MSFRASTSSHSEASRSLHGRGGALAALLALFLDLLWRATIAPPGVPSMPESVVAAVARLTPTSLFGWATENFGSLAQNTLWAIVLIGTVLPAWPARPRASWPHPAGLGQAVAHSLGARRSRRRSSS